MITDEEYIHLKDYIFKNTGIRIQDTSQKSVKRYVFNRIEQENLNYEKYLFFLENDKKEKHRLINAITINETYFFREQKYFKLLEEVILPDLSLSLNGSPVLLWSAASSIGAEPVSMALLCSEFRKNNYLPGFRVYASDIDIIALENIARNSFLSSMLKEDGSIYHDLVNKYSETINDKIIFSDEIISKVITFKFNLVRDDYSQIKFAPNVVFLRNILTYMDLEIKNMIMENISSIVPTGGYIILSSSDTAFISNDKLELCEYNNSFYFKKRAEE